MDTFSRISMDSDDSIPKNVFQEVIVDSTIHTFDSKMDAVEEFVNESKINEPLSGSEDETDDDDEDVDSNFSTSTPPANETTHQTGSADVSSISPDKNSNSSEDLKTANLKLVLKKSPEYQLTNHSIVQTKTPTNKIFLLTLVSNTATGPIYSTAKYSVAGETNVENSSKIVAATSLPNIESTDYKSQIDLIRTSTDLNKQLKIYGKEVQPSASIEEIKTVTDKPFDSGMKYETDADAIKSETDLKTSTPKIKRELKQLQKTVNESKILSEYMNDYSTKCRKTRKVPLKNASDSEGSPILKMRSRSRSCSKPRIDSPVDSIKLDRWPSQEKINKRQNMRSQNTEFVQKHMKFLNSIQADDITDNSDGDTSIIDGKSSSNSNNTEHQIPIAKRDLQPPPKPGWDCFCFKCHSGGDLIPCSKCIRSYHAKCVKSPSPPKAAAIWHCPECIAIENCLKTSVRAGKSSFTIDHLSQLLQFALKRMKQWKGSDNFATEKSDEDYPEYSKYVINPVTLEKLQENIENKTYKCTEEFAVDAKWLLHNSSVYFGNNTKLPNIAKSIVKVCRQEVTEIDTCAECYYNANTRKDWFVEVCSKPHILLWAKLKGFPYWPAKAMGVNAALVNVRFFGDHDRAYVPIKECFLYSQKDPNPPTKQNKRSTIAECIKEVDIHIRKITAKFGSFIFPPYRTVYDPSKEINQLEIMIPGVAEALNNTEKTSKPALTYKIVKTANNHLSIIKKSDNDVDPVSSNTTTNKNESANTLSDSDIIKRNVKSTDSTHSNNDFSSSSETLNSDPAAEKIMSPRNSSDSTKTYEVVSKTIDKEQAKVSSVILKRKSDNWNTVTPSVSKKHKAIPEMELPQEQPVSSSDDLLQIVSKETPTEPIIATTKRKRSREESAVKVQKQKLEDINIPPLVLLAPFVITTSNSCLVSSSTVIPSLAVMTSLNSSVSVSVTQSPLPSTSTIETNSTNASAAMSSVKLFDNSEISIKRVPKKSRKSETVSENSFAISEKDENCISSSKAKDSTRTSNESMTVVPETNISQNTSKTDGVKRPCELIPFEEIKTEKPDIDDAITELVEVRSKTATPEQPSSSKSNIAATGIATDINFTPTVVKNEITSDDEESSNQSKTEDVTVSEFRRISVKDISKLRAQPITNKKMDAVEKKKFTKPESKKQRARKSFPNKGNFNFLTLTTSSTPPGIKRPVPQPFNPQKNLNSMVYIPVDTKASAPPIPNLTSTPLLTAISKTPVNSSQTASISNPVFTNVTVASVPSTILTTSIKLPIVYSTVGQASTSSTSSEHMLSGFVTPTLASAITDTIVRGPPKLAPRPIGPFRSEGNYVFPSEAGPVCKMLMNNAHKMTDFFRSVIEDSLSDMANNQNLEAKVKLLELELEKIKHSHGKELAELKHNTDLMLCEMRTSLENEKTRLIADTRKQCELERIRAVEEAKTKQWCASCGKEAQFYCCWNTSYCDYPCQQKHWTRHMSSCAQKDNTDSNAQKIGVKMSPYNLKEKQSKNKEPVMSKMSNHSIIRAQLPVVTRNSVPTIKRLIPISTQTTPRYTLINNHEGNWGLVTTPPFPRILPTPGLLMTDTSTKALQTQLPGTIIRTTKL